MYPSLKCNYTIEFNDSNKRKVRGLGKKNENKILKTLKYFVTLFKVNIYTFRERSLPVFASLLDGPLHMAQIKWSSQRKQLLRQFEERNINVYNRQQEMYECGTTTFEMLL